MATITLQDLRVVLDGRAVLDGVDLDVADSEVLALLASSGAGKTTLLRAVAGLVPTDDGRVLVDGVDVTDRPTRDRGLGMVAQGAPLLPHLDVARNIALPLEVARHDRDEVDRRVRAEARAFRIRHLLRRRPPTLSTGERHAAATARAVVHPRAGLLLDEPVTHLDPLARAEVLTQLRALQSGYGTTVLLATNDVEVARTIADRVAVLDGGTVAQVGRLDDVLAAPVTLDVADLVAPTPLTRLPGRVVPPAAGRRAVVRTAAGDVGTWRRDVGRHAGAVVLGIGPTDAVLAAPGGAPREGGLRGTVRRVATTGPDRLVDVATDAGRLVVRVEPPAPAVGEAVVVAVRRAVVGDADGRVVAVLEVA